MKILLYTGFRTGSLAFAQWLSHELDLVYYDEPLNITNLYSFEKYKNFDISKIESGIIKITPRDNFNYEDNIYNFDKIIVLYRKNTLEQAESIVWALHKKVYHYMDNNSNCYYSIDTKFLEDNKDEILNIKNSIIEENKYLTSLKNCIHIEYEEFFYSKNGIKKVEEYLAFKSKSIPNPITKLRNNTIKNNII